MTSKLPVHMPVNGPDRDFELLREICRRFAILGHISNFLDLIRRQLIVSLRAFLEFFQILHGDQPIPAKFNGGQSSVFNQGKYALRSNAQDFTGMLGGELIHMK